MQNYIVENAKVMSKGQITLPKDIREHLKLETGDRVTLVCEGDKVILMNSAIYAMRVFQNEMAGIAESENLTDDDAIQALVDEIRTEDRT